MSLRTRVALIAAAAVAVSVLLASAGMYAATARTLHAAVDRDLAQHARDVARGSGREPMPGARPGRLGAPGVLVQVVTPQGAISAGQGGVVLPVSERARAAAPDQRGPFFETVRLGEDAVRVLTIPAGGGGAIQFARATSEIEETLGSLRRLLTAGGAAAVLLAALLGTLVARRAVRPVHQLTELAEEVAATHDLTRRIDAEGDDELGRLARTFNDMLAKLEQARSAQEQLIADASHELRTPLTSLRTNVEVLAHVDRLEPAARRALLDDVVAQLDEFGRLVTGLVELARGAQPPASATELRLDRLVARVVEGARTTPGAPPVRLEAEPCTVSGEEDRLERAVANLVDNAIKYGDGSPVDVAVRHGAVSVRDRGPGIPPEHLARVFERFYRAPEARSAPGSGLGLSIVRQAAEAHGGSVEAANADGGGAVFTLRLPAAGSPQ